MNICTRNIQNRILRKNRKLSWAILYTILFLTCLCSSAAGAINHSDETSQITSSQVISLDGQWLLATDPENVGRNQKWWREPVAEAKPTKVPWVIQDIFPGYHGLAWYWRDFEAPSNSHKQGRYLLRFQAVDYKADVWVNDNYVAEHEGGESPFVLDVTEAIKPNQKNRVAVRVLNPTKEPIEGISLQEVPHGCKYYPLGPGGVYNVGGIVDSVELLMTPPVRVKDLFVRPDPKTGVIRIQTELRNDTSQSKVISAQFTVAPATWGDTLDTATISKELSPGETVWETELQVINPRLWELNDPYMYRVTARVWDKESPSFDEYSVRCGFREFRYLDGYFRLNGKRIFLCGPLNLILYPIGFTVPHDPDMMRRDVLFMKAMDFNICRLVFGGTSARLLDVFDEMGVMAYQENYGTWLLYGSPAEVQESPKVLGLYDKALTQIIRRDRNHPSVVIWGLLNETSDGRLFRHAVDTLPLARSLDDSRMIFLSSGRWDNDYRIGSLSNPGSHQWESTLRDHHAYPMVPHTAGIIQHLRTLGSPVSAIHGCAQESIALHPGGPETQEMAIVRWTAPQTGEYRIQGSFSCGPAEFSSTLNDYYIIQKSHSLLFKDLNTTGISLFDLKTTVQKGDIIDWAVGSGTDGSWADTTMLKVEIVNSGSEAIPQAWSLYDDFDFKNNPSTVWSYGSSPRAANRQQPDTGSFTVFNDPITKDDLSWWQHKPERMYNVPAVFKNPNAVNNDESPHMLLSEYGTGNANNLVRFARYYEQLGAEYAEDARYYRDKLDRFLADWQRWKLNECWARPEDFFADSDRTMAQLRWVGLNALRSNPNLAGHFVCAITDSDFDGVGLLNSFRELKPGVMDAVNDTRAPLRWCLFTEPVHIYRGANMQCEAVLANEDVLRPGEYPVRFQVVGPDNEQIYTEQMTITVSDPRSKPEPPLAWQVFSKNINMDGPSGKYRFLATFERGGAAMGGETIFYVTDSAEMPAVDHEIVLWGDDPELEGWLAQHDIRTKHFSQAVWDTRKVILVGNQPEPAGVTGFRELAQQIARGSTAIFLSPAVFAKGDNPTAWLPLSQKGNLVNFNACGGYYRGDSFAKKHPIFEGLPCGGIMDYTYYREIIPQIAYVGLENPEELVAGAIRATLGYESGNLLSMHKFGHGRFILNTLLIQDNLGEDPAAERLLRNMLRYAMQNRNEPLMELPDDFDSLLKNIGYL